MKTTGFLLCLFWFSQAMAQGTGAQVQGQAVDSFFRKNLAYATVSLVKAKDSSLVSFTRADSAGRFALKGLDKGEYLLSIAYVGYVPTWQPLTLKPGEQLALGPVYLTDVQHASSVTVTARRPPVTINNDTVEFNTENFKTAPNAVVEDLLKRLPGVTVDKDGTVKVNGQRVSRFLVNGKEFFTGDPKMATQNLDADAVDKVQVFDRKSDRAEFTGMEDGQTSKAINLKLKKDRDKSTFGRVSAGAGNDGRFEARGNVNRFNGDEQMSFLGMANNTNKQGFSLQDVMNFTGELARGMRSGGGVNIRIGGGDDNGLPISGMGQNQQGIAETYAGGLNYNNTWKKKTDLNLNGILSDINLVTDQDITRKNILPGNAFDYFSNSSNVKKAQQQRLVATWDQKIDSFTSLRYVPQLTWQQGQQSNLSTYRSISETGQPMNEGRTRQVRQSTATNLEGNFLLRHKFRKKGRTLSATLAHAYNESKQNGELQTLNRFFVGGVPLRDSIQNQINTRDATTRSVGGNLVYTEPLGKKTLLEANVYLNSNNSETEKLVFDYNSSTGKYDQPNALLSNDFKSDYVYGGGGLSLRSNIKKFSLTGGANLQAATLSSINQSRQSQIRQNFTDWLPLANVQYKINGTSNLTLNYNTSTIQPSAQQLQPVPDVSDPLNTYVGNPNLKRSYQHAANLSFSSFDIYRQRNFFGFVTYTQTQAAIVNADFVQANGARTTTPINRDGNFFLLGNFSMGRGIKKLKSRVELGLQASMFRNQSVLNGVPNVIDNISYTPNLNYQFSIDSVMDVLLTARVGFNQIRYSQQPQLNDKYLQQNYGLELTNYLPAGLVLVNNFDLALNSGRADGFNVNVPLWNISVAKTFLKHKKGELKLSLMDALNRNIGINRSANMNFIQDTRYTVLRQYWLLTFTYRLNRANSSGGPQVVIRTM